MESSREPRKGLRFNTSEEFETFMKAYQQESKQIFVTQSSLTNDSKHKMKKKLGEGITFYSKNLVCKHGSQQHASKQRVRNTRSAKVGCPARVRVHATRKGDQLVISRVNLRHKGHLDTDMEPVPEVRRLSPEQLEEVERFIKVKASRPYVIQFVKEKYKVTLRARDMKNIEKRMKKSSHVISEALEYLQGKGARVDLLKQGSYLEGIFWTEEKDRVSFKAYGSLLGEDVTYKCLDKGLKLLPYTVVDCNLLTEVVAMAIVRREDKPTHEWLGHCFKKHHGDAIQQLKFIIADKDPTQRAVLKVLFPWVIILICIFHVFQIFDRELPKLSITAEQKERAVHDLRKLSNAKNETNYQIMWYHFKKNHPSVVVDYVQNNWDNVHNEWSCFHNLEETFDTRTNNRNESLNAKIKQVVPKLSSLSVGVKSLDVWREFHEGENDEKIKANFGSKPKSAVSEVESLYRNLLMNVPFGKLQDEFRSKDYVTFDIIGNTLEITAAGRKTTSTTCNCRFYMAYHLPCCHIFAARQILNLPLYDENLCLARWTKAHCKQNHRAYFKPDRTPAIVPIVVTEKRLDMSQYNQIKIQEIISDFSNTISLSCGLEYRIRLVLINEVMVAWANNTSIDISECEVQPQSSDLTHKINNLNIKIKQGGRSDCQKRRKEVEMTLQKLNDYEDEPVNSFSEKVEIFDKIRNLWICNKYAKVCLNQKPTRIEVDEPALMLELDQLQLPPSPKMKGRPKGSLNTHTKAKAGTEKNPKRNLKDAKKKITKTTTMAKKKKESV